MMFNHRKFDAINDVQTVCSHRQTKERMLKVQHILNGLNGYSESEFGLYKKKWYRLD